MNGPKATRPRHEPGIPEVAQRPLLLAAHFVSTGRLT
jgi:hypothetical protein